MTVSSLTHPPFAHELLIAQMAVQRAALVTKRVLASINAAAAATTTRITSLPPTLSPSSSDLETCASPVSQYLHPSSSCSSSYFPPDAGQQQYISENDIDPPRRLSVAKPDASPVTVADLAAQALLVAALRACFPDDAVLGEEDASALRADPALAARVWELVDEVAAAATTPLDDDSEASEEGGLLGPLPRNLAEMLTLIELGGDGAAAKEAIAAGRRVWTIDPIDGTSAYMQGGQYAISVALLDGGREVVGVLGCPNWRYEADLPVGEWRIWENVVDEGGMGLMLSAVRGQGATVRPMGRGCELLPGRRVDRGRGKPVALRDMHFVDSQKSPATLTEKVRELARMAGAAYRGTNIYSSHMRYAAVVLGGRECVQLRWPKPTKGPWSIWDHAGSQLIYTESGAGKVTDLFGKPIDFTAGSKLSNNRGLVTADESIHGEILAMVDRMRTADA
ncbi:hypothetical protein C7999DRAFT_32341 [Corynascus novoguineensis]|uniref:3'(2'),5'-bisphosphate nucleotidase n=1 Tax=Corynascus novoguineensis TaxID=1126955 RepID=A0AAN7CS22_9PEZI|nr:hypothetical protein C7999DRAFT_32341 [Corynascus novoguineensis]